MKSLSSMQVACVVVTPDCVSDPLAVTTPPPNLLLFISLEPRVG